VIISKNERLISTASRHGLPCLPIRANTTASQIVEVAKVFNFSLDSTSILSRCVKCNHDSFTKLDRQTANECVPPESLKHYNEFWQCDGCRHVFWRGTHFRNQVKRIQAFSSAVEQGLDEEAAFLSDDEQDPAQNSRPQ